jgi:hypothetical protein
MKKTSVLWMVIAIIITTLTSCTRYEAGDRMTTDQKLEWKNIFPDSITKNIIHYFDLIGPNQTLNPSQLMLLQKAGVLNIPDSIIKDIPCYYRHYYSECQCEKASGLLIVGGEIESTDSPTFLKAARKSFHMKVVDTSCFREAAVTISERASRLCWMVIAIILIVVLTIVLYCALGFDEGKGLFNTLLCGAVIVAILIWIWFYMAMIWAIGLTILPFIPLIIFCISDIREKRMMRRMRKM